MTEVTAGGVGIIIGAGIYVLVGTATAEAGAGVWLAFAIAAALSFLTALSYIELSSMYSGSAGEYEYARQAFPEWFAFSVGWVMIAGLLVAAAAISLGFATYLGYFIDIDVRVGAVFLLALVSLIAVMGIKESARLTLALSAVQVGGLLFVVGLGDAFHQLLPEVSPWVDALVVERYSHAEDAALPKGIEHELAVLARQRFDAIHVRYFGVSTVL